MSLYLSYKFTDKQNNKRISWILLLEKQSKFIL